MTERYELYYAASTTDAPLDVPENEGCRTRARTQLSAASARRPPHTPRTSKLGTSKSWTCPGTRGSS